MKDTIFIREYDKLKHSKKGYEFGNYYLNGITERLIINSYHEIFELEPYYFEIDNNKPYIIDCGANIGVSVAYFKTIFPDSKILAFEPNPEVFKILKKNIRKNNIKNVILKDTALASTEGEIELNIIPDRDRSSTLTDRLHKRGFTTKVKKVKTERLSKFLMEQKVDFLKIDIEGVESEVLKDCSLYLKNVDRIFLEYHYTLDYDNKLSTIFDLLLKNDFVHQITSPERGNYNRPFTKISNIYSINIYAIKRELTKYHECSR